MQGLVLQAGVVVGGKRHLDLLPEVPGQHRLAWPSPLRAGLPALLAGLEGRVVALASGDPLVSGIGATLIEVLGADRVAIHPAVSSIALARARLGWASDSCAVVSVVGRDPALVLRELAPGRRVLVLSSDEETPAQVAGLLTGAGYGASTLHVLGDLGAPSETHVSGRAEKWSNDSPRLHVLALELDGRARTGWTAGLPDDAFEHDGQLTKRDLRASALARLAPTPGAHLWDVGAGAGSIGIEWMRAHPTCHATAIEGNPERAARIARNASRLGVPGLEVVTGRAPEVLETLTAPDAIFVGGGATAPGMLDACLAALAPGRQARHARRHPRDRAGAGPGPQRVRRGADPHRGRDRRAGRHLHGLDAGPLRDPVGAHALVVGFASRLRDCGMPLSCPRRTWRSSRR